MQGYLLRILQELSLNPTISPPPSKKGWVAEGGRNKKEEKKERGEKNLRGFYSL